MGLAVARALALPSAGTDAAVCPYRGVPMGVLSCVKYLMFIFNVLVFVSPPGLGGVGGEGTRPQGTTSPDGSGLGDTCPREGTPVQVRDPQFL